MKKFAIVLSVLCCLLCFLPASTLAAENCFTSFDGAKVTFSSEKGNTITVTDGKIGSTKNTAKKNADGMYWQTDAINISTYHTVSTSDKSGCNVFFADMSGGVTDHKSFIGTHLNYNATATMTVSDNILTENTITIKGAAGDDYSVFVSTYQPSRNTYITMLLRGTQWSDTLTVKVENGDILLYGAKDVEVTLDNPTTEGGQITTYANDLPNPATIDLNGFVEEKSTYKKITTSDSWLLYVAKDCNYTIALNALKNCTATGELTWDNGSVVSLNTGNNLLPYITKGGDISVETTWNKPFHDISKKNWYYSSVAFANTHNLFDGVSTIEFAAENKMTRAMLVTVLWRMCGEPIAEKTTDFDDVAATDWFAESVAWAADYGITTGIDPKTFAPNDPVTREQLVTLVDRCLIKINCNGGYDWGTSGYLPYVKGYTDFRSISTYAQNSMAWAIKTGIINGYLDNTLQPQKVASRAEVATITERVYYTYNYFYAAEKTMTPNAPYAQRPAMYFASDYCF